MHVCCNSVRNILVRIITKIVSIMLNLVSMMRTNVKKFRIANAGEYEHIVLRPTDSMPSVQQKSDMCNPTTLS